jgi:hypothetical protein
LFCSCFADAASLGGSSFLELDGGLVRVVAVINSDRYLFPEIHNTTHCVLLEELGNGHIVCVELTNATLKTCRGRRHELRIIYFVLPGFG